MKWPILTKDDRYSLRVARSQAGIGYIVLSHSEKDTEYVHENLLPILQRDGFNLVNGVVLKQEKGLSPAILREAFSDMSVGDLSNKELGKFSREHSWIKSLVSSAHVISKNKAADQVVESFDGHRFIRTDNGLVSGTAGELLVWDGVDSQAFRDCMDAFALQVAQSSSIKKYSDLESFATQITGKDKDSIKPLMRLIQEGLEAALLRYQKDHGGLDKNGFDLAYALYSRQPLFEARTSSSVTLQQYSTPMHLNVIAQRILGDVEGKRVLEPTIGNASLVSQLSTTNSVYGADLDKDRINQANMIRPDAHVFQEDATVVDFRSWLTGADAESGFDVVIANPPFGALESKQRFDDKINVSKIDHLILLRSLAARSDSGTGVFIIGADSYVDSKAGEVLGSSKYLLNYLQDHYEIDVVELPGHLYARQGASFPIRMLVIGERYPENKIGLTTQIDITKPLPVIGDINALWAWSDAMRNKYGFANDVLANPFSVDFADANDEFTRFKGSVVEFNIEVDDGQNKAVVTGDVVRVLEKGNRLEVRQSHTEQPVLVDWSAVTKVSHLVDNVKNPLPDIINADALAGSMLIPAPKSKIDTQVSSDVRFSSTMRTLLGNTQTRVLDNINNIIPDLPSTAILMNAARPIVGDSYVLIEDSFIAGVHYAVIDSESEFAADNIKTNQALDARVLLYFSKEEQIEMVLHNHRYEEQYREAYKTVDKLYSILDPKRRFHDMPFNEVMELWDTYQKNLSLGEERLTVAEQEEQARYQVERNKAISAEIYRQLGRGEFNQVTGAKNITTVDNGLSFILPSKPGYVLDGINEITITLTPSDTYMIAANRVRMFRGKKDTQEVAVLEDIYADNLLQTLERLTGLATRMPRISSEAPTSTATINVDADLYQETTTRYEKTNTLEKIGSDPLENAIAEHIAAYASYTAKLTSLMQEFDALSIQENISLESLKSIRNKIFKERDPIPYFEETTTRLEELGVFDRDNGLFLSQIESSQEFKNCQAALTYMEGFNDRYFELHEKVVTEQGVRALDNITPASPPLEMAIAVFLSHGIDISSNTASIERLIDAIDKSDVDLIKDRVYSNDNKASMEVFERLTDVKLDRRIIKNRFAQIDEWAGISLEQRAEIQKQRAEEAEKAKLSENLETAWDDIQNFGTKIIDGDNYVSLSDFILGLHKKSYEPKAIKRGAATEYRLSSPDGESNIMLKKNKIWNAFVKGAMLFGDGTLTGALVQVGAVEGKKLTLPSKAMGDYEDYLNNNGEIGGGLIEQIRVDYRLNDGEAEQLIKKIDAINNTPETNIDSATLEYLDQLKESLKSFSVEDLETENRLKKSDFDLSGNSNWFVGVWGESQLNMTNDLLLLDNDYPSAVSTLLRNNKFDFGEAKNITTWLDNLIEEPKRTPLSVAGVMKATDISPSIIALLDGNDDAYLVDEPLMRLALQKYPEARFFFKQGMIEIADLNDDSIGFLRPLNQPSKLIHTEFYAFIAPQLQQLKTQALASIEVGTALAEDTKIAAVNKTAPRIDNSYQAPYEAGSKLNEASSMIPVNLKNPVSNALHRLQEEHGNIDEYVARKLDWSLQELAQYLSAEQTDAVALSISAIERGRGLLEGDQTGLGKGRVMAAMARYAVLNDEKVMFFTETPTLFSDLWRDIKDIGSEKLFKTFIMNDSVAVFDVITGDKTIMPTHSSERTRALDSGSFPEGANLVMATYSQFNREISSSKKSRWLTTAAEGAVLLMDESHNAAGNSNTGNNFQIAVDVSQGVIYSSATAMKNASNVMIYSKLFPDTVDLGAMPETLAAGGEVLQEVLSSMLAEDGVFIRREHDLSNLTMETVVDHAREERNRVLSDKLASVLELMNYLAGDISELVNERNKQIKKMLESIPENERKGNRMGAINVNFGSRLFSIYRQFLMSIKVDETVEQAKRAVAAGQKPVIILENTMESLLNEVLFNKEYEGEDDEANAELNADIQGVELNNPNFRDVLYRMLERISTYQETDRYGNITRHPVNSEGALELIEEIKREISSFPDLSASPIDDIVNRLAEDDIFCDELTGRKTKIITENGRLFATRIIERPKATIVSDFNSMKSEAIILSRSGSTGISLHSGEKFKDKRQRVMIELQAAADVNTRVQFFGRVNRKGQVNEPIIRTVSSGLIGEARPIAMQNAKLRMLSANTTSNQDNAALDEDIPDFLNPLGDKIARRYLEQNPSIAQRLDIDTEKEGQGENQFINKLTSRLVMLKSAEQEMIYDELTTTFVTELKALDAKGENPLKSLELDISARLLSREVETSGNPFSTSVFDHPIYFNKIEYTEKLNPLRSEQVDKMIAGGSGDIKFAELNKAHQPMSDFIPALVTYISANRDTFLTAAMSKRHVNIQEALACEEPNAVHKTLERVTFIEQNLADLMPGSPIIYTADNGEPMQGIVTRLSLPDKREQLHQSGKYSVQIVAPGMVRGQERSLYALMADSRFTPKRDMGSSMADVIKHEIENAPKGERILTRNVLDGNMFGAAQRAAGLGNSVVYTNAQGERLRGLMLSTSVTQETLRAMPIRLDNAAIASEIVSHGISVSDSSTELSKQDNAIRLEQFHGLTRLTAPGSVARGGHIFKDKKLLELLGEFTGTRTAMSVDIPQNLIEETMGLLYSKGISFYAAPTERERIEEIKLQAYANKSYDSEKKNSTLTVN